jgi:hypothetical protein
MYCLQILLQVRIYSVLLVGNDIQKVGYTNTALFPILLRYRDSLESNSTVVVVKRH